MPHLEEIEPETYKNMDKSLCSGKYNDSAASAAVSNYSGGLAATPTASPLSGQLSPSAQSASSVSPGQASTSIQVDAEPSGAGSPESTRSYASKTIPGVGAVIGIVVGFAGVVLCR
jgi:hypothetical protein